VIEGRNMDHSPDSDDTPGMTPEGEAAPWRGYPGSWRSAGPPQSQDSSRAAASDSQQYADSSPLRYPQTTPASRPPAEPGLGGKLAAVFVILLVFGAISEIGGCSKDGTEDLEEAGQELKQGPLTQDKVQNYLCETADFRDDPSC